MMDSLLENLNDQQRAVVEAPLSNMLIIAGAGTGKTRVLISRIAYLMAEKDVKPWNVLAMTFTNKSANEMQQRLAAIMDWGTRFYGLQVGTFHSICTRLLRQFAAQAMLPHNFSILAPQDQKDIIRAIYTKADLLGFVKNMEGDFSTRKIVETINHFKERNIEPMFSPQEAKKLYESDLEIHHTEMTQEVFFHAIYAVYELMCQQNGAIDFTEIIHRTLSLLRNNADIREQVQNHYQHIFVDEFQDTSSSQYELLCLLAGKGSYVCVVGDDDQAIYGWRGADSHHIFRFEKEFRDVQVFKLFVNYRSQQNILNMANKLLEGCPDRYIDKQLMTPEIYKKRSSFVRGFMELYAEQMKTKAEQMGIASLDDELIRRKTLERGEQLLTQEKEKIEQHIPELLCDTNAPKVSCIGFYGLREEADSVCKILYNWHEKEHIPYNKMAVLYRNNSLSANIEAGLTEHKMPYEIYGGLKFYERAEIKDVLAYLQLILNPKNNQAFSRAIASPRRGIGKSTFAKLREYAENCGLSFFECLDRLAKSDDKKAKSLVKKFIPFYELILSLQGDVENMSLSQFISLVIQNTGLESMYATIDEKSTDTKLGLSKVNNLRQLIINAEVFEKASGALLMGDEDECKVGKSFIPEEADYEPALEEFLNKEEHSRLIVFADFVQKAYLVSSTELNEKGEQKKKQSSVQFMTIHAAKGLEFDCVLIVGFEKDILPGYYAEDVEEERRLAYVALTRAKKFLTVTFNRARPNFIEGQHVKTGGESIFLREIVQKYRASAEKPFLLHG